MVEITQYTTKEGDTVKTVKLGGGYLAVNKSRSGSQPHLKGKGTINKTKVDIAGWWNQSEKGEKYITLSIQTSLKLLQDNPTFIDESVAKEFHIIDNNFVSDSNDS